MLNLNCKIKVYETDNLHPTGNIYQFTHVENIHIKSSYKNFTDTAVITMPKKIVSNKFNNASGLGTVINKAFPILKEVSINEFLKQDYYIEVFLGYDGNYKPAFRGYIREVKGDAPVEIICDDMMYYLKKYKMAPAITAETEKDYKNSIPKNSSYTVDDPVMALEERLKEINLPFDMPIIAMEDIGSVVIKREVNIVQFLQILKKEYDIYSYFKLEEVNGVYKSVLHITNNPCMYDTIEVNEILSKYKNEEVITQLPKTILNKAVSVLGLDDVFKFFTTSDTYIGEAALRFHYNIISDTLKVKESEVTSFKVRAEEFLINSNTPIAAEVGDTEGKLLKKYTFHNNNEELEVANELVYKKKEQEIQAKLEAVAGLRLAKEKKQGLTGAITTFGEPFMRPLDKVYLQNAEEVEKEGLFQVEEVERTYGVNGYRQILTLGRVLTK